MNLTIKATKTTLTPALKKLITDKLEAISRFLHVEDKVHVEVEVDKHHRHGLVHRVEIHIRPDGLYADARGGQLYEALDLAIPKIKDQIVKRKDRKIALRRQWRGKP
jgi:ribosomal subunit interface protein